MKILLSLLFAVNAHALSTSQSTTLADSAVTTAKLAAGSVTTSKLSNEAILPLYSDQANGRVGINTKAPGHPLSINHASAPEIGFKIAETNTGSIFATTDGIWVDPAAGDGIILRSGGGSRRMIIDSGGAVTVHNSSTTLVGPNGRGAGLCDADTLCVANAGNAAISIAAGAGNTSGLYFSDNTTLAGRVSYNHTENALNFGTNQNDYQLYINSTGKIGVGTSSPCSTCTVHVAGTMNITGDLRQGSLRSCATGTQTDADGLFSACVASDAREKVGVKSLAYDSSVIDSLRPVAYKWRDKKKRDAREHVGFIAQEVDKSIPQAVLPAGINEKGQELKGIDPNAILAAVVLELKELRRRLAELEK